MNYGTTSFNRNLRIFKNKLGKKIEFDGFWSSSLTDSTLKGKPDIEVLDINQRLTNINDIFDVTTKPLIIDIDTGGKIEHLEINNLHIEIVCFSPPDKIPIRS